MSELVLGCDAKSMTEEKASGEAPSTPTLASHARCSWYYSMRDMSTDLDSKADSPIRISEARHIHHLTCPIENEHFAYAGVSWGMTITGTLHSKR